MNIGVFCLNLCLVHSLTSWFSLDLLTVQSFKTKFQGFSPSTERALCGPARLIQYLDEPRCLGRSGLTLAMAQIRQKDRAGSSPDTWLEDGALLVALSSDPFPPRNSSLWKF